MSRIATVLIAMWLVTGMSNRADAIQINVPDITINTGDSNVPNVTINTGGNNAPEANMSTGGSNTNQNVTQNNSGLSFVDKLTGGQKLHCEAKEKGSGRTWPCIFVISKYNPSTGAFYGDLAWPSLDSLHHISGNFSGNRMSFKEDRVIKAGSAYRGSYVMNLISERGAGGTYREFETGNTGIMKIFNR
jgi:hypothetical protein